MKPIAKSHIVRLKRMVKRMDEHEEWMRQRVGNHIYPGSERSVDLKDAATLRKVIDYLEKTSQP